MNTRVEDCSCFTIRRAARQAARLYDAHLQPTGLRITQFLILAVLAEVKTADINALSERLDIERTATGKMVSVLVRDGLVQADPAPGDARTRLVELTMEGSRLFIKAVPLWQAAQRQMEALNGKQRVTALRAELTGLAMRNAAAAGAAADFTAR